jgi:Na+/H+ antiporter NhaA
MPVIGAIGGMIPALLYLFINYQEDGAHWEFQWPLILPLR